MPERVKSALDSSMEMLNGILTTAPFSILLVILLLLGNKIKFKAYEILIYFIGSVITGYYFSSWAIEIISKRWFDLSDEGATVVTACVTIFGFLSLVYIVKNDLVNGLINSYFKRYTKKIENGDEKIGEQDGDPK